MCGRYVLLSDLSKIERAFEIQETPSSFSCGNNISPGEKVLAVTWEEGKKKPVILRWGFVPAWSKDLPRGGGFINARAETLTEKASFRQAFYHRRCLIVADGFYEWEKIERGRKKPWFFHLRTGKPFALAGLYETWLTPRGEAVDTCTIVTTRANELISPIHDRMPVIIPRAAYDFWIDPMYRDTGSLEALLKPYPAGEMMARSEFPVLGIFKACS